MKLQIKISNESSSTVRTNRLQARYWIATIPAASWSPPTELPKDCSHLKGQKEVGSGTGYEHWQIVIGFRRGMRCNDLRRMFSDQGHYEPTRSGRADEYVWKDDTSVAGTRFEMGEKPKNRNSAVCWESVRSSAQSGNLEEIPADVYVRYYHSLRRIAADFLRPVPMVRSCDVFFGSTGTGKSREAWERAGLEAYSKDPRTKWWCGYSGQKVVVIDEFRGAIDVAHLLRWLDRYPVCVETKGGTRPLCAERFFITSNLEPKLWYPELDPATLQALLRRLTIREFS